MKTDDLIEILSANVAPVDHRRIERNIRVAIAVGIIVALIIVIFALGPRADLTSVSIWVPALLKISATAVILVPASVYLVRLARPGGEHRTPAILIVVPFIAVMALAALSLTFAPTSHWRGAILSDEWLECLISIPLIAVMPFAVITWVVRQMAPTDLARTGAVVGLISGCISAAGYAVHCNGDTVPFVVLWYGGTIAICTLVGWKLGPRLFRW